jgi:hypothetical protein
MSTTLNAAPPAAAPKGGDFIKLPPFKKTDSYVATIVGGFHKDAHPFKKIDEKTGKEYTKIAPSIELYLGAIVDGEVALVTTWPKEYNIHEKANYCKWFTAATGSAPTTDSKPAELMGKALMVEIDVREKVSAKGTRYLANKIKSVSKVPSILASTITPLDKLQPAFDAAVAGRGNAADATDAKDGDVPF